MSIRTLCSFVFRYHLWTARMIADIIGEESLNKLMESGMGDGWFARE